MNVLKKTMATLLAAILLLGTLPAAALEDDGTAQSSDPGPVIYNLGDYNTVLLPDPEDEEAVAAVMETAEAGTWGMAPSFGVFGEDGGYEIVIPGEEVFFPYSVQFQYGDETEVVWFSDPEDTAEIGGHPFTVALTENAEAICLEDTDEARAYLTKEFTTDGSEAMLLSRNPLTPLSQGTLQVEPLSLVKTPTVTLKQVLEAAQRSNAGNAAFSSLSITDETPVVWKAYFLSSQTGYEDYEGYYRDGEYDDRYHIGTGASTIDVAALLEEYGSHYNGDYTLTTPATHLFIEFITGTADGANTGAQTDMANKVRGTVRLDTGSDYIGISAYESGSTDPIGESPYNLLKRFSDSEAGRMISRYFYYLYVYNNHWAAGKTVNLKISQRSGNLSLILGEGEQLKVYTGYYDTLDALTAAGAQDVTDQILIPSAGTAADISGYPITILSYKDSGYWEKVPKFTLAVAGSDGTLNRVLLPFGVRTMQHNASVYHSDELYYDDTSNYSFSARNTARDYQAGTTTYTFRRPQDSANNQYYYRMDFHDPEGLPRSTYISQITANGTVLTSDQMDQLFGGGYPAVYSGRGVTFVISYTNRYYNPGTETVTVKVESFVPQQPSGPVTPEPEPDPVYPTFTITGARKADNSGDYSSYVMQDRDDGYYQYGYQTVLLDGVKNPDPDEIIPTFYTDAGTLQAKTVKDASALDQDTNGGVTEVKYTPGQPVQYTAYAGGSNSVHRNYWVTYLAKTTTGPNLFVNGVTNIADGHKNDQGEAMRLVVFDDAKDYHDLFVANIGGTDITNLTVTLENASNVKLDDYWTFNNSTLTAWPANLNSNRDDELQNIGKIRLVPIVSETDPDLIQGGPISGTLKISYTDQDGHAQTITVQLTGVAGDLRFTNDSLRLGVKWVPYVTAIQDNTMINSSAYRYQVTGRLPRGLEVTPAGEIYGVPQEFGEFPIHVSLQYTGEMSSILTGIPADAVNRFLTPEEREELSRRLSCEGDMTLYILENLDENVHEIPGQQNYGYEIETHVGVNEGDYHYVLERYEDTIFQSAGPYNQFVDFYLDGQRLTRDRDYLAEEGSTVITIKAQTLRNAGSGTHTIAAEFFPGGARTATSTRNMKTSSQNYTIGTPGSGGNSGSSGGNRTPSRSSGTSSARPPVAVTTPPNTAVTPNETPFGDVSPTSVFYQDIKWVYENNLMIGTTSSTFSPGSPLTPGAIVTVLSRMTKADLSQYTEDEEIPADLWYAAAAIWAKQSGLLPEDGASLFQSSLNRGQMAVMLVKYMEAMGMTVQAPETPAVFADAADMTPEAEAAFQILYQHGVFQGTASGTMDPNGITNRGQFAALIHRTFNVLSENTQSENTQSAG